MKHLFIYFLMITFLAAGCGQGQAPNENREGDASPEGEKTQNRGGAENASPEGKTLTKLWETPQELSIPESVCYGPDGNVFYVANIAGKPTEKDGVGFISRVSAAGEILDLKWAKGLDAPKGMAIVKGSLYVSNIDELVEIDLATGAIEKRFPLEGAKFANDVAANSAGDVFVSDMASTRIYRVQAGMPTVWLDDNSLHKPNGLFALPDRLMIGCSDGVYAKPYGDQPLEKVMGTETGIDGLEHVQGEYFLHSDWTGHVFLVHPENEPNLLLNTADQKINAADICFVKEKDMLLIPTFMDNRVMAYKLE